MIMYCLQLATMIYPKERELAEVELRLHELEDELKTVNNTH